MKKENLIKNQLLNYIKQRFYIETEITEEDLQTPIFDLGIDSIDYFEILDYIQKKYEIQISEEDVTIENLGSISKIINYIIVKRAKK